MAEIVLAVLLIIVGIVALGFAVIALPWSSEPNAPKGIVAWPLGIAVACIALAALLILGG